MKTRQHTPGRTCRSIAVNEAAAPFRNSTYPGTPDPLLQLWPSGPLAPWPPGPLALWPSLPLALSTSGPVYLWPSLPLCLSTSGPLYLSTSLLWPSLPLCLSTSLSRSLSFSLFFLSQSTPLGIRFSISAIFYCPDRLRIPCYTCVSIGFLQCPAPSLNFQLAPQEAVVWRTEPSARGTAGRPWLISGIQLFLATWQFQSDGFPDL